MLNLNINPKYVKYNERDGFYTKVGLIIKTSDIPPSEIGQFCNHTNNGYSIIKDEEHLRFAINHKYRISTVYLSYPLSLTADYKNKLFDEIYLNINDGHYDNGDTLFIMIECETVGIYKPKIEDGKLVTKKYEVSSDAYQAGYRQALIDNNLL